MEETGKAAKKSEEEVELEIMGGPRPEATIVSEELKRILQREAAIPWHKVRDVTDLPNPHARTHTHTRSPAHGGLPLRPPSPVTS